MRPTIDEITKRLRQAKSNTAGIEGEKLARKWLTHVGWTYKDVDQSKNIIAQSLRRSGGKRPDFLVDTGSSSTILMLDAKYHNTNGRTEFAMTDFEIQQYKNLITYIQLQFAGHTAELIFMLFPKEDFGARLLFIGLDEFDSGIPTNLRGNPATAINIVGRYNDPNLSFPVP